MLLISTRAVKGVLDEVMPAWLAESGIGIAASFDPTAAILPRIRGGERADVTILTSTGIEALIADNILAAGSQVDLARSAVGIAVRAGAPAPDVSSVEAFRRMLIAARSIAYPRAGASGLHFARVLDRLGLAREVAAKAIVTDGGLTGELAAAGEAEIAVQQVSELLPVAGIEVAPLPEALQERLMFSGGVFSDAPEAAAGRSFLAWLARPELAELYRCKGLDPA